MKLSLTRVGHELSQPFLVGRDLNGYGGNNRNMKLFRKGQLSPACFDMGSNTWLSCILGQGLNTEYFCVFHVHVKER